MPRIPTSLLRQAYALDPFLPALLRPCRDLPAAQNELRWLREHVDGVAKARRAKGDTLAKSALLGHLIKQRASGKPLQYILGSEYFGDLVIKCRPGVLVPRQDTAASISHLVRLLRDAQSLPTELRVLDLCTGTGCIPLLFRHELNASRSDVALCSLGVDISDEALKLARHNSRRMRKEKMWDRKDDTRFMKADILMSPFADLVGRELPLRVALNHNKQPRFWDILVSNPPYISPSGYWKTTTRSVRGYEPMLALVPPARAGHTDTERGDAFYTPLLNTARDVEAKIVLLEIADLAQALRVARKARELDVFDGIEIWRDQPALAQDNTPAKSDGFEVVGAGNARSVVCWRGAGARWLRKRAAARSVEDGGLTTSEADGGLAPSFDKVLWSA